MSSSDHAVNHPVGDGSLEGFILLGLAVLITIVRTYSRLDLVGPRGLQADDFLVWFAVACYAGETANLWELQTKYHDWDNHQLTAEGRAALDVDSQEYREIVIGSKLHLVDWYLYGILLWSLKLAMLINVSRLMQGLPGHRRKIHTGYGLIGLTFVIAMIIPLVACTPVTKYWQLNPDPGVRCYAERSPYILWTFLVCNILTDIYLTVLPMPMLWKSTLSKPTKLALIILFGCGILVAATALFRAVLVVSNSSDFHDISVLPVRETFIAILTTNLPAIFVLMRRKLSPFVSFLRSTKSKSNKTSAGAPLSTRHRYVKRHTSRSNDRRGTFMDQLFESQHETKTEIYAMKGLDGVDAADLTASQERIIKSGSFESGRDEEIQSVESSKETKAGPSQQRFGYSAGKLTRSLSRGNRNIAPARLASKSEDQFEHGITKQVEITIVEERSEQIEPSEPELCRVRGSAPFGYGDVEAGWAPISTRGRAGSKSNKSIN